MTLMITSLLPPAIAIRIKKADARSGQIEGGMFCMFSISLPLPVTKLRSSTLRHFF